jgi:hypothetical protein
MTATTRKPNIFGFFKYILASIFVVWHCGALIIAPAPASFIVNEAHSWYEPYLALLNLNNGWAFFAPEPRTGAFMRYTITDQDGNEYLFDFNDQLNQEMAVFQRYTSMLETWSQEIEPYTESAGLYLCQQHKNLNPVQIQFKFYHINIITPEAYMQGARPLDEGNLALEDLNPISCPS